MTPADDLERLDEDQLEAMLLEATAEGVPGRSAMARVTALRTILRRRREQRRKDGFDADHERALQLVNAHRGAHEQLTEIGPVWVASITAAPCWAELYVSDDEMGERSNG